MMSLSKQDSILSFLQYSTHSIVSFFSALHWSSGLSCLAWAVPALDWCLRDGSRMRISGYYIDFISQFTMDIPAVRFALAKPQIILSNLIDRQLNKG